MALIAPPARATGRYSEDGRYPSAVLYWRQFTHRFVEQRNGTTTMNRRLNSLGGLGNFAATAIPRMRQPRAATLCTATGEPVAVFWELTRTRTPSSITRTRLYENAPEALHVGMEGGDLCSG